MDLQLKGRTALVTGASAGIGVGIAECLAREGVRLALSGSGARVHLPIAVAVRDNGAGIAEDLRAHLFDPFVTGKAGGQGLGLALVAKIVGDHGGLVEAESVPGRTTFRLMLPMAPDHLSADEGMPPEGTTP